MKQSFLATLALVLLPCVASAELTQEFAFTGNGNWSIDGVGSNSTPVGTIGAVVPVGSTIEKAFLYSSQFNFSRVFAPPTVVFDGTTYLPADFTALGENNLEAAYRTDVTTQVIAKIGGGSAVPFSFTVNSETPNGNVDGEVLAIIYSNPAEALRTIAFLDGFSASVGDDFTFNFADPLDLTQPGFEALMSLGIGFSSQPSAQDSRVIIDGRTLTNSAGGQDDGANLNGALITVGGIGDDPTNPDPTDDGFDGPEADDELYNLALGNVADASPFLTEGATSFFVQTLNESNDDNIFFVGINVTAEGVITPGPPELPEPMSLILAGFGLAGFCVAAWRWRKSAAK